METYGFHEETLSVESKSTEHVENTHIDNVNNDDSDNVDSVMTQDFIPSTQLADVAKSIVQPYLRHPAENVAVPSCSRAQPGLDLHWQGT
jgi:hypothetical protein